MKFFFLIINKSNEKTEQNMFCIVIQNSAWVVRASNDSQEINRLLLFEAHLLKTKMPKFLDNY